MDEKRLVKECLKCMPVAQRQLYDRFCTANDGRFATATPNL
jgi:hypothetical protein